MRFVKMHGLGNDYIYLDGVAGPLPELTAREIAAMSDRHFGIGSDGVIEILPGEQGADFRMRMFNADGSEAEMCGNGIRCFAKYVYEAGYATEPEFAVLTGAGVIRPRVEAGPDGKVRRVRVDMGEPRLRPEEIPVEGFGGDRVVERPLPVEGYEFPITCVSMGNPHCVIFVEDAPAVEVPRWGPLIERHPAFPARTNVEFVQVVRRDDLIMRVWERGSGITWACGTGACASLVAAVLTGRAERRATLHLLGGDLEIEWSEADNRVYMTGPAEEIYRGEYRPR